VLYALPRRMKCALAVGMAVVLAIACSDGPVDPPCRSVPDFSVEISSVAGWLPENTVVSVTFGGGSVEEYSPSIPDSPVVLFCMPYRAALGAGGAGGVGGGDAAGGAEVAPVPQGGSASGGVDGSAGSPSAGQTVIRSIHCELWTGGPANLRVQARAWDEKLDLERNPDLCTTADVLVLGDQPKN
jgi:hypothetical protein